jgi:hypothetical protein
MRKVVRKRDIAEQEAQARNIGAELPGARAQVDGLGGRLLKHIPAETVTAFVTLSSAAPFLVERAQIALEMPVVLMIIIAACALFNVIYLRIQGVGYLSIGASLIAFTLWVVLLGGEQVNNVIDAANPDLRLFITAVVLAFWTLVVPIIDTLADR